MSRRTRAVGRAVPIERKQRLWAPGLVEDSNRIAVGDEPVVNIGYDEEWWSLGQIVGATTEALGGASHDNSCFDPSVTTTTVGDEAQGRDGAVGVAGGPDLVPVDQARQRSVRGSRGTEDLVEDEAHVTGLVADVPSIGTTRRLATRQREQGSGHHIACSGPGRQQLLIVLWRAPQAVSEDDERVWAVAGSRGRAGRPSRVPDGRHEGSGGLGWHPVPWRRRARRVDEGHCRGRHRRGAGRCANDRGADQGETHGGEQKARNDRPQRRHSTDRPHYFLP